MLVASNNLVKPLSQLLAPQEIWYLGDHEAARITDAVYCGADNNEVASVIVQLTPPDEPVAGRGLQLTDCGKSVGDVLQRLSSSSPSVSGAEGVASMTIQWNQALSRLDASTTDVAINLFKFPLLAWPAIRFFHHTTPVGTLCYDVGTVHEAYRLGLHFSNSGISIAFAFGPLDNPWWWQQLGNFSDPAPNPLENARVYISHTLLTQLLGPDRAITHIDSVGGTGWNVEQFRYDYKFVPGNQWGPPELLEMIITEDTGPGTTPMDLETYWWGAPVILHKAFLNGLEIPASWLSHINGGQPFLPKLNRSVNFKFADIQATIGFSPYYSAVDSNHLFFEGNGSIDLAK